MSVTININNLSLCHKASNGISMATVPDICKTPSPGGPVPIPYPNIALSMDLVKGTTSVKADGGNMCANYGSEFSKSTGDEGGSLGGMCSGTFMKEATWLTYSFDIKLEGAPACRLTDKMLHNHGNTVNLAGEIQKDLPPSVHKCTLWHAEWADGPLDVFEELEVTPPLVPELIGDRFLDCWFVHFKLRFRGTVKCTCAECDAVKTQAFESPVYEGNYKICYEWTPSLGMFVAAPFKSAQLIMKLTKALILAMRIVDKAEKAAAIAKLLKEHGDTLLSAITAGAAAGKALLIASASAICSGTFDVGKLQGLLDTLPTQPLPRNMA